MQNASQEYKAAMKLPFRNRGYIKVTLGIINSDAQENIQVPKEDNQLLFYSDTEKVFDGYEVKRFYATPEQNFSRLDGSRYFLPSDEYTGEYYYNGVISEDSSGEIYFDFGGATGYDIKGLTINFGEFYPKLFSIEWDNGKNTYENGQKLFFTEDVFDGVSFLRVAAHEMINGNGRLRINQFSCGISKNFSNANVRNYTYKEHVSPITETIPSQDMSIEVDNQERYYDVDNPDSAIAFLEIGQELRTSFGYDVTGNGDIEWMPPNTCYLKTWKADSVKAQFTGTDIFDNFTGKYYGGVYKPNGISLFDLALDVLSDMGITDEREYVIDPYLKKVMVTNPIPVVKHTEALQLIANAGRCILYPDRKKRIRMKASFVPDMTIASNGETVYSHVENVLNASVKDAYAITSNDFSLLDGSLFFLPDGNEYKNTGYISSEFCNENGIFTTNPMLTIELEAAFVAYGMIIRFRNVAAREFLIKTYLQGEIVQEIHAENTALEYVYYDEIDYFDKLTLEFTKGHPNSRITIDNILIDDITDYTLTKMQDLIGSPQGDRGKKVKSISVTRNLYEEGSDLESKEIKTEEITLNKGVTEHAIYFTKPVYDMVVSVENNAVSFSIKKQSCYMVLLRFVGVTADDTVVKIIVTGKEYQVKEIPFVTTYNEFGDEITWNNPLVSTLEHAKDMEKWLAEYYLGQVSYNIQWRGDPRTDANDLFYLEGRETKLIRAYEKTLKFNGAWQETMKAREAVVSWQ